MEGKSVELQGGVEQTIRVKFKKNKKSVKQIRKLQKCSKKAKKRSKLKTSLQASTDEGSSPTRDLKIKLKR